MCKNARSYALTQAKDMWSIWCTFIRICVDYHFVPCGARGTQL